MKELEETRKFSQNLRKNMTKEERHLWYDFLKAYPIQFRRQYTVGPYIVDFYCYQAKLVLELDGSQHFEEKCRESDKIRTKFLEQQGLSVMRISNLDVMRNFRGVCEAVDLAVKSRLLPDPHPSKIKDF